MALGLRRKIAFTYVIFLVLLTVAGSFYFLYHLDTILLNENKKFLQESATLISSLAQERFKEAPSSQALDSYVDQVSKDLRFRVSIIDKAGKLLADSDVSGRELATAENHSERPEVLQARTRGEGWGRRLSATTKQEYLYYATPLFPEKLNGPVLRLAFYIEGYKRLRAQVIARDVFLIIGILIVSILTSLVITRWVLNPIEEIRRVAGQFAKGEFEEKLHLNSKDEIGELAATLNQMGRKLEEQLAELTREKSQLEAILSNMQDGVLVTTRSREILLMNPAFKVLFRASAPEGGRTILEYLRSVALEDFFRTVVTEGRSLRTEMTLEREALTFLEISAAPILAQGVLVGVVAVFHNVTERRKIEEERRDFLQNVSHELKTPLTSIKGYVEGLLEDHAKDKELSAQLKIIKSNSDRLESLIADTLDLSRVDSGKIKPEYMPLDVRFVSGQISQNFKSSSAAKKIQIIDLIPQDLPKAAISEAHFNQILSNLLSNAVRYSKENSEIKVRASVLGSEGRIRFEVEDQGIGIAKEHLDRIFERFYRVDRDRSRATGGTGLGLSIVKLVVETYGGSVGVKSQLGVGSTFSFDLPVY